MSQVKLQISGFVRLFISKRLIHGAATALMGIFLPIFLFTTLNENFFAVGIFYALISTAYIFGLVPSMKLMNRFGFRTSLVLGGAFSILTYILLYFTNSQNIGVMLWGIGLSILLFRIFHWVPYHVNFTIFTRSGHRGRSVGLTYATVAFMGVVGPILAGYIVSNSGYDTLFVVAGVLLCAATISYGLIPNTDEKFTWSFLETWRNFFGKKHRNTVLGFIAVGAEATFTLIVWPIFLYVILSGNLLEVGAVSTLVAGVTIILQLLLGRLLDDKKLDQMKTFRVGSVLYAVGWIVKIFVLSAVQVFFVGLYHSIAKIFTQTPIDMLFYDMSADQGHYVDEFTVLRELAIQVGRVAALAGVALLSLYVSLQWTFIIGAISSLLINVMYRVQQEL